MSLRFKQNVEALSAVRNLSPAFEEYSKSVRRLASGQKLVIDRPSGLVVSELLRSRVASLDQAIENTEISTSLLQTAEGALTEVNNILLNMRQLAVASANYGAHDQNKLLTIQNELEHALRGIDWIAKNTAFGRTKLLDGSKASLGIATGEGLKFIKANLDTRASPIRGYEVEVTELPTQAIFTNTLTDSDVEDLVVVLEEKGVDRAIITSNENETAASFFNKLKNVALKKGMNLGGFYNEGTYEITLFHQEFGSAKGFSITSSKPGVLVGRADVEHMFFGTDIEGKIAGEKAQGNQFELVGTKGNSRTEDLHISYKGKKTGIVGKVTVAHNPLVFQIGPDAGQQIKVTLEDTSSEKLAQKIENRSGFSSLRQINVLTPEGAADTIRLVEIATQEIAAMRGELGSIQKNFLQVNNSNLRIAVENVAAAESNIRNVDIAFELANFTRNQIMLEAGAAVLAQANDMDAKIIRTLLNND